MNIWINTSPINVLATAVLIKTPNNLSTYNSDINVVICKFFKNISTYFPYSTISRMYNIHSVAPTCLDESYSSTCIVSSGYRSVPKKKIDQFISSSWAISLINSPKFWKVRQKVHNFQNLKELIRRIAQLQEINWLIFLRNASNATIVNKVWWSNLWNNIWNKYEVIM